MTPKFLTHHLKLLFAAHHYVFNSKDPKDIADVLKVKKRKIQHWMKSYEWIEAVSYWQGSRPAIEGDLDLAEQLWEEMIEKSDDLSGIDFPETPFKSPQNGNPAVYALIQSHLFCVDGLCDEQIRARLSEEHKHESSPVKFEGQPLENIYHWWIFPNFNDGIFSKCFARANSVGNLVIGNGKEMCFVIIRHGRLTITRQVSDDAANVSDGRLLVCL